MLSVVKKRLYLRRRGSLEKSGGLQLTRMEVLLCGMAEMDSSGPGGSVCVCAGVCIYACVCVCVCDYCTSLLP